LRKVEEKEKKQWKKEKKRKKQRKKKKREKKQRKKKKRKKKKRKKETMLNENIEWNKNDGREWMYKYEKCEGKADRNLRDGTSWLSKMHEKGEDKSR